MVSLHMWHHPKVLDLPSDSARWAWLVTLSVAKPLGGSFANDAQLKALLGPRFKFVKAFREAGLLDDLDVHDWDGNQKDPDSSARDRARRYRERKRDASRDGERDASRDGGVTRHGPKARAGARAIRAEETETDISTSRVTPERPDVEELCSLLADLLVSNGMRKRPEVTATWRSSARLLLDADKAPLDEAVRVMRWALHDGFWRTNIQSLPKFREKYEQLRLKAGVVNGSRPGAQKSFKDEWEEVLADQEAQDAYLREMRGEAPVAPA